MYDPILYLGINWDKIVLVILQDLKILKIILQLYNGCVYTTCYISKTCNVLLGLLNLFHAISWSANCRS